MDPKCEECKWYDDNGECVFPGWETSEAVKDREYSEDICGPLGRLFEPIVPDKAEEVARLRSRVTELEEQLRLCMSVNGFSRSNMTEGRGRP